MCSGNDRNKGSLPRLCDIQRCSGCVNAVGMLKHFEGGHYALSTTVLYPSVNSLTRLKQLCEPAVTEHSRSWLHPTLDLLNQNLWEFSLETGPSKSSLRQVCLRSGGIRLGNRFLHSCIPTHLCPQVTQTSSLVSFLVTSGSLHN